MVSLRQVSFGKEEETRTLKPFVETLRVRIPPGKAGPAARSESCVVVGRPILRSVDSEVKGRVGTVSDFVGMVSDFVLGSYVLSSKPKTKSDLAPTFSLQHSAMRGCLLLPA